jgi:hypothetical protein
MRNSGVKQTIREWFDFLFSLIPNYGVRRVTQLEAVVRYELRLLANEKTESLEFITGLFSIAFAIQLIRPGSEFSIPYYGQLTAVAPAGVWTVFMLAAGIDKLIGLFTATRWCRRMLAAAMTGVWSFIAAVCWLTAPASVAPALYTVIAFTCGWTYVRLGSR